MKCKDEKSEWLSQLWYEFLSPNDMCGLCGQTGVIDTRTRMFTPAGYECGVLAYCICPNGRAMKQQGWDLHAPREGGPR